MEEVAAEEVGRLSREEEADAREARFAELVERQSRFLYRVAYALLRNAQDAEDVVQETFLKLYRTGAWERMDNERGFLARTAWRMALSRRGARPPLSELDAAEMASHARTPEETVIDTNQEATVHRLIDALPESLRQPLVLAALQEMTSGEVAGVLGIEEGTVRTRILRARQVLKDKLAALNGDRYGR